MVLNDIKALLDKIEEYQAKKQEKKEIINMNKVLTALYRLGDKVSKSASIEKLQDKAGFSKSGVINAIERAENRKNYIQDVGDFRNINQWILTKKGCMYVEGLIEEAEEKQE